MAELVVWLLAVAAQIAATAAVLAIDERRAPPERLARAWPPATRWVAIAIFSPLSLVLHFARTRRSVAGLGLGMFWLAVVFGVVAAVVEVGARLAGLDATPGRGAAGSL